MGPAGRHPRGKQSTKSAPRHLTLAHDVTTACECPACSPEESDAAQMLRRLFDVAEALVGSGTGSDEALRAEVAGAAFVAMATIGGDGLLPTLAERVFPQVEAAPGSESPGLLLAIGSVAAHLQNRRAALAKVAATATAAAGRLVTAGVPEPAWAGELAEPVRLTECLRLHDTQETASVLVASFERAGHGHALAVVVDELDCGAAVDLLALDADRLPGALDAIRENGRADGLEVRTQVLEPAELRWYAEAALDARAAHDEEGLADPVPAALDDEEAGPPFPVLALLARARLATLPPARRPAGARQPAHTAAATPVTLVPAPLASVTSGEPDAGLDDQQSAAPAPAELPAKRPKSAGQAPIYQLKVGLRGAKPPIWRRLLVPADVSLSDLHGVIQAAFDWADSHLHVFETPYGHFGFEDEELGHRAEQPVTLEQVVRRVKDKIRYTYDFGDGWAHEILLEKVIGRDPTLLYPRCTGGRRAAPPEDSGGVWGYTELLEILADPGHPQHAHQLEWLGLEDASQFDPAEFDVDEANRALARLR